jgi:hypothetical protein
MTKEQEPKSVSTLEELLMMVLCWCVFICFHVFVLMCFHVCVFMCFHVFNRQRGVAVGPRQRNRGRSNFGMRDGARKEIKKLRKTGFGTRLTVWELENDPLWSIYKVASFKKKCDWRTTGERPVLSLKLQPTADATVLWLSPSRDLSFTAGRRYEAREKGKGTRLVCRSPEETQLRSWMCRRNDLPFGPQPHSLPTALNNDSHFKNLATWTVMTILPFWTANVPLENSWFGDVGQWSMPQLDLSWPRGLCFEVSSVLLGLGSPVVRGWLFLTSTSRYPMGAPKIHQEPFGITKNVLWCMVSGLIFKLKWKSRPYSTLENRGKTTSVWEDLFGLHKPVPTCSN